MSISVSAFIPNYNDWEQAARCARSIVDQCGEQISDVLIVDDCSDAPPPVNLPSRVRVVENDENRGVIYTENKGFDLLDTDVIVILDSDAEPLMNFVQGVQEAFATDTKLGALAFHLVDREGNPTGAVSPEPTVGHFVLGQRLSSWVRSLTTGDNGFPHQDRTCLHSCGVAVRRESFEEVGGFDEGFDFLDYDIDFSMRLRRAGWNVRKSEDIVAYHEGGGSPQSTAKRVLRYHRNRWRLLRKHGKIRHPSLVKALLAFRHGLEYGLLRAMGSFVTRTPEEREDKLAGRQVLLRTVWNGYED